MGAWRGNLSFFICKPMSGFVGSKGQVGVRQHAKQCRVSGENAYEAYDVTGSGTDLTVQLCCTLADPCLK